ncbi:hypothetical protein FQN49_001510 [Arthroderma sp. PD_2]|nr:hypothetical protein FQN49_001510 [Arthroderma sp. PD_2]
MNWTGGRLHRSSYKTKSSSKALEKQRFAKAKLRIINRAQPISPVKIFAWATAKREGGGDGRPGSTATAREHRTNTRSKDPSSTSNISGLSQGNLYIPDKATRPSPSGSPTVVVDEMRRKLLDKKDWARLNLARPYKWQAECEKDMKQFGRRRPLTREDKFRRAKPSNDTYVLQQTAPNKRQKITQPMRCASTQLSPGDISVWVEQQRDQSLTGIHPAESLTLTQESAGSMLFDTKETRGGSKRNLRPSSKASIQKDTQHTAHGSPGSEREQPELANEASPSPEISDLPILDRRGSFVTTGSQTRYVPPAMDEPENLGPLEDTENQLPTGRNEKRLQGDNGLSLRPTDRVQGGRIPENLPGSEVANTPDVYRPQSPEDCNSTAVKRKGIIFNEPRHSRSSIMHAESYSLDQSPRKRFIKPPTPRMSRYFSQDPTTSPSLIMQETYSRGGYWDLYDSSSPAQHISRHASTLPQNPKSEQRTMPSYPQAVPKAISYNNSYPQDRVSSLLSRKVLVYGQEVDLSEDSWSEQQNVEPCSPWSTHGTSDRILYNQAMRGSPQGRNESSFAQCGYPGTDKAGFPPMRHKKPLISSSDPEDSNEFFGFETCRREVTGPAYISQLTPRGGYVSVSDAAGRHHPGGKRRVTSNNDELPRSGAMFMYANRTGVE